MERELSVEAESRHFSKTGEILAYLLAEEDDKEKKNNMQNISPHFARTPINQRKCVK